MEVKKILLDTNAYAAFKKNNPQVVEILQYADSIYLNPIIIGELLGGFAAGSQEQKNKAELAEFLATPRIQIVSIETNTAKYYAQIYAELRRKGRPILTNDIWIAASALEHGLMLCSYDQDFNHIESLLICKQLHDLLL